MVSEKIIVIGAGISGLSAASALRDRGYNVTVLEARRRSGGRIHTQYCVDMGAHWIYGTEGNPITNLARKHGLETIFVGGDSTYTGGWDAMEMLREKFGRLSPEDKWKSILVADKLRDALEELRREASKQGRGDLSIAQAVSEVLPKLGLEGEEYKADLAWHVALFTRDDCAATADALSALYWDEGYEVFGYGDSVFTDGYAGLIAKMEQGLDIRYQEVVTSIDYRPEPTGRVRIMTKAGEYRCHRVIVTLPLGVLKSGKVRFLPALSDLKTKAIERLGVGVLGKISLFFPDVFWKKDQYVFGYLSESTPFEPTHIINMFKTHQIPCLQIVAGGALGKWLEQCSIEEAHGWAMRVLKEFFGRDIPSPTRVLRTNWSIDEFALGAYTFMQVGSTPEDARRLAEPVGDWLFFAGEATNPYQWGCTHGAYTSGLREAARICGDTSILPVRHFSENRRWREMMLRSSRFFNQQMRTLDEPTLRKRLTVLTGTDVFRSVPPNEMRLLAAMFEEKRVTAGELICNVGDKATEVYVIAEGAVEVWLPGARRLTEIVRERSVVGEYGMFTDARRNAKLVASGPTVLLSLDYQRFERFLLAFPESTLKLFKTTVQKFIAQQNVMMTKDQMRKFGA